jgi:hypothetical protein
VCALDTCLPHHVPDTALALPRRLTFVRIRVPSPSADVLRWFLSALVRDAPDLTALHLAFTDPSVLTECVYALAALTNLREFRFDGHGVDGALERTLRTLPMLRVVQTCVNADGYQALVAAPPTRWTHLTLFSWGFTEWTCRPVVDAHPCLTALSFDVSCTGLVHLRRLPLRVLQIRVSELPPGELAALTVCTRLHTLCVRGPCAHLPVLTEALTALPCLTRLSLDDVHLGTAAVLQPLVRTLRDLCLAFTRLPLHAVTLRVLMQFAKLRRLRVQNAFCAHEHPTALDMSVFGSRHAFPHLRTLLY